MNFKLILITLIFFIVIPLFAQDNIIPFDSDQWIIRNARIVDHLGRKALMGFAYLKDIQFENGVIEVDLAVSGTASYPGIFFRMQDEQNYEHFYVRPHRAGRYADAMQYAPTINGISSWQLYNGEGYTAAIEFPSNQWIHLKLEISGRQARVFVNHAETPDLVINHLQHGNSNGTIGLSSQMDNSGFFSNFSYRLDQNLNFDTAPEIETHPGVISDWQISQPFPMSKIDIEKHPADQSLPDLQWQSASIEPNGLVNVARYFGRTGNEPDCIYAKTIIRSEEEKVMQFMFGYSDIISIFLNGKTLFLGQSAYRQRDPSFLGIIGYFDAVYLPLRKGENELLLNVTETFGGWGFMGMDANAIFEYPGITKVWEIDQELRMPESAVYDNARNVLYISNFDRFSAPGQQFISKVTPEGKIISLKWADGFFLPLGMSILKDKLYVVERKNLAEVDLESGKILNRYPFPQPLFPNDLAIDKQGNIYISDSQKATIYKFSNGVFEVWLSGDSIDDPNGMFIHQNQLFIGNSGDHSIKRVDLKTKQLLTYARFGEGIMDGIKMDKKGNLLLSIFEGIIYRVTPSGEKTKMLHLPAAQCADFEYVPEKNLLVIPGLQTNKVIAYQITK